MTRSPMTLGALVLVAWTAAAGSALAQGSSALVEGTVRDVSGALAGAAVTLESNDTGLKRTTVTRASGYYVLSMIPPGTYSLSVGYKGYKTYRLSNILLGAGQSRTVDVGLQPAEVAQVDEVVEVVDTLGSLERFAPEYGRVVRADQLSQLPLNGRQWGNLMILAPGASQTTSTVVRLFGRASNDNNWTMDGVDATGVLQPQQDTSVRLVVSLEALSEFRVSSSLYTADYGRGAGAQVQLVSKTGTNRFGGTVYDYIRDAAFDARPFGASVHAPFRMHQFGASLGGPLRRDKTFFFVNYEGLRQDEGVEFVGFVPSARFRSGASPAVAAFLGAYPGGSEATADPNVDKAVHQATNVTHENSFFVRLDHRFSNDTTLMAWYNQDRGYAQQPQGVGTGLRTVSNRPKSGSLQFQRVFSPTVVNSTKVAFNNVWQRVVFSGPFDEQLTVPGFVTLTGNLETFSEGRSLSLVNDFSLVKGRHQLRLGGEVRSIRIRLENGVARSLNYASRPDFSSNQLESFSITSLPQHEARSTYYAGYLQDDVKATLNFTLNLGLRYEYYSVMREAQDRARVFSLDCGGYCPPGTPFYEPDWNNIAPRIGFNWAPARFGYQTVVRGGYGVYFGPGRASDLFGPILNDGARTALTRIQAPTLSYPLTPFLPLAATAGDNPVAIDRLRRDGYAEQYGLSVQQQLPSAFVLQMGYFGSQAHKMYSTTFINLIDPATGRRPLPQFSIVPMTESHGNSAFNGLEVSLQRHAVNGFSLGAEYTLAFSRDNGSVGAGDATPPQNVNNRRAEIARSIREIRHAGTLNWIYELPWGPGRRFLNKGGLLSQLLRDWDLAGLLLVRSGRPLTVTVTRRASDLPDNNNSNQRPDLVPGVPLKPPGGSSAEQWINPAAFAVPAKGTWGNAPRNLVTGPAVVQLDLSLTRYFRLWQDRRLGFQWSVFNVFNRDELGTPVTSLSAGPSFGQITSPLNTTLGVGTNRQMQFMLRVQF